jgi:hypothetical protein
MYARVLGSAPAVALALAEEGERRAGRRRARGRAAVLGREPEGARHRGVPRALAQVARLEGAVVVDRAHEPRAVAALAAHLRATDGAPCQVSVLCVLLCVVSCEACTGP